MGINTHVFENSAADKKRALDKALAGIESPKYATLPLKKKKELVEELRHLIVADKTPFTVESLSDVEALPAWKRSMPALEKLSKDEEPAIRMLTAAALTSVGYIHESAMVKAMGELIFLREDEDEGVRREVVEGIGCLGYNHIPLVQGAMLTLAPHEGDSVEVLLAAAAKISQIGTLNKTNADLARETLGEFVNLLEDKPDLFDKKSRVTLNLRIEEIDAAEKRGFQTPLVLKGPFRG
ncbi:MAG TPA: HEAT repeat domain-containing protein [Micavibrio sp.]|jgi:HEAT repeat protein